MNKIKKIAIIACVVIAVVILSSSYLVTASASGVSVFLGGTPIGVVASAKGAMVSNIVDVMSSSGAIKPSKNAGIEIGDIVLSIDNIKIKTTNDIKRAVDGKTKKTVKIVIERDGQIYNYDVEPIYDIVAESYKLGLIIKNDIGGVGTLTYMRADNNRFGGLGHQIYDPNSPNKDAYQSGNIYKCNIIGLVKGEVGKAGELRGIFNRSEASIATLQTNKFCGIFGVGSNKLVENRPMIEVGGKSNIRMGKAQIYTSINGSSPEKYDIEIIKATNQNKPAEKSMVIKITDSRLLEQTGGILQGMSGSPIVQDNKLVGAVTHVFLGDPTRGYGIYIDWMINN